MNPSAVDWIQKYLHILEQQPDHLRFRDENNFYDALQKVGFIYGVSIDAIPEQPVSNLRLTREEYTKVNLFHALYHTHLLERKEDTHDEAFQSIISFYETLDKGKTGFFRKISLSPSWGQKLEKVLSARLQETNSFLKKGSTGILTYALLYVDVIAYRYALSYPDDYKDYAETVESTVISCCYLALQAKKKKNKYDKLLIDLFQSSTEYLIGERLADSLSLENLHHLKFSAPLERRYLLDICTITIWDDHKMDEEEYVFLREFCLKLELGEDKLKQSLTSLSDFMAENKTSIKLFEYSNPVKLFYNQSTATVKLLILRNRRRLQRELEESGELLVLLSQSTVRELNEEEKSKVKQQLLDICKTIPSLTVFLLPGGTVLLPILIKFIPKLLPSSFHENRIDKK